jgi:hypothetical protein
LLARCAFSFEPVCDRPAPPAHPFLASSLCQRTENLSVPTGAVAFASSPPRQRGGRFIIIRRPGVNFFFSVRFVFSEAFRGVRRPLRPVVSAVTVASGGRFLRLMPGAVNGFFS